MTPIMRQILGGRRTYYYNAGFENVAWVEGYSLDTGSVSKEATYLQLNTQKTTVAAIRTYVTNIAVDLTKIKKLYIDWEIINVSGVSAYLNVSTNKTGDQGSRNAGLYVTGAQTRTVTVLDVSNLIGLYYIRVHSRAASADISTTKVYRLWGQ